jgi:hypothetical protein
VAISNAATATIATTANVMLFFITLINVTFF